ncbi:MAG: hypothetical protein KBD37_04195 [Burkholderiales bacterium]|nr:hypothetical protein [Burkholderiales bacterium]
MSTIKYSLSATCSILAVLLTACNGGGTTPSTQEIKYTTLNYPNAAIGSITGITGIQQVSNSDNVYITGSYFESYNMGTLYEGPILGGGTYYTYMYPSSAGATTSGTNLYSVDNSSVSGNVILVGSYQTEESGNTSFGFLYNGPIPSESSAWQPLNFPSSQTPGHTAVLNTIPHSIMNDIVVGNYDTSDTAGNAFIYNISTNSYSTLIKPGSVLTTAYGVWWNGGTSYTISGGYSNTSTTELSLAFIVDYDSSTGALSNWMSYNYNNQPDGITHFEGITSDGLGGYNLASSWLISGVLGSSFVNVSRNSNGKLNSAATWINVSYPGSDTTTADTVYKNYCLGVYSIPNIDQTNGYVATIPTNWYFPYYYSNI